MNEQDEERVKKIAYREARSWAIVVTVGLLIGISFNVCTTNSHVQDLQRRVGHLEQAK